MIKNIIFDLGGVILKDKPSSILKKIDVNEEDYSKLLTFFNNWKKLDLGKQTLEEKFLECNFSEHISSKFKDILLKYYEIRDINNDIIELIKLLQKNNYKVYVLSDNNSESFKYYKNLELFNNIDYWILSCDYGALKVDGNLFEIMFEKYKLIPEECYFIDDKQSNIDIANKYHIKGFIFNENLDINLLYKNMKDNGINI